MFLTITRRNSVNSVSKVLFTLLICSLPVLALGQPVISGFSPSSGPVGTVVTIVGSNFDPNPANDIVYFGTVKGNVLAASTSSLTVPAPAGASYQPLTVTANSLTAYSRVPFRITGGGIDTASEAATSRRIILG